MKFVLSLVIILSLSSCAVYRVQKLPEYNAKSWYEPISELPTTEPKRLNPLSEGFQCFEPMLYVLTLGIVPSHCVGYYQYGNDVYKVTDMTGWIPAIYPLFSGWRYDFGNNNGFRTEMERLAQPDGI